MSQESNVRSVTPLPPFKNDWTQSDIRGLSQLAGILYNFIPQGQSVIKILDKSVEKLVHAASWQGEAAQKFREAWEKNATDAARLHSNIGHAASIIDELAVRLGWIQVWWEAQASRIQEAQARGENLTGHEGEQVTKKAIGRVKKAQRKAAQELNALDFKKLTPAMRAYLNDPEISDKRFIENAYNQQQNLLKDDEDRLHHPKQNTSSEGLDDRILGSHTVKDMTGFAGAGGSVDSIIGAGIGLAGGPFSELTVPAGIGVGAAVGGVLGGIGGGVWGLGEDLHIW